MTITAAPTTIGGALDCTGCNLDLGDLEVTANAYVENGSLLVTTIGGTADVTFAGTATVTVTGDEVTVGQGLVVADSAKLLHAVPAAGEIRRLDIVTTNLTVEAEAAIDASARGWPGGAGNVAAGSWPDGSGTNASAQRAGGSHGGIGANGNTGDGGIANDRLDAPSYPGGGGGQYNGGTPGGRGGGVVQVLATGSIAVNGVVRANGSNANGGGGAGGSIFLHGDIVSGTGTLEVNGGSGNTSYNSGGGGGGRIAVIADTLAGGHFAAPDPWTWFSSRGGYGYQGKYGGAGTVYLDVVLATGHETRLIVDNGDGTSKPDSTPLLTVGEGVADAVGPDSLTDFDALWQADYHLGGELRANLAVDPTPGTLLGDVVHRILADDGQKLTLVPAGVDGLATIGGTYRGITRVDRLQIRGAANVRAEGDLLVRLGDLASLPAAGFTLANATLTVEATLDLPTLPAASIDANVSATTLLCADCP